MARLASIGFELNTLTTNAEITGSNGVTIQTTTVRSGTYALKANNAGLGVELDAWYTFASAASNGPYFARAYLNIGSLSNADTTIIGLNNGTSSTGAYEATIVLTSSGTLKLFYNNGGIMTQIGSASGALSTGQWYCIELWFDKSPAGGSQVVKARIDQASEFASATNLTINAGVRTLVIGASIDNGSTDSAAVLYYDDIAINDSTGSNQTSYPGAGKIVHLRPSAAGDNNTWTREGTDSGANWSQVNEVTPNDNTNLLSSNTTGNLDDYNIDDTPGSIGSSDTISVVQVGVRYAGSNTSANASFVARIKKASAGTVSEGSTITPSTNAWFTNANSSPTNPTLTLYKDPDNSAWTKATLDTAQIGIHLTASNTNKSEVTALWLMVDSTPAGNVTTTKTQTGKARITASTTQTQTGKSRITVTTLQTLLGKARIQQVVNQTQQGKARITATALQTQLGKSRITASTIKTQQGKGRIQLVTNQTQTGKSRIQKVVNQTIQGLARVTVTTTKTQLGKANIQHVLGTDLWQVTSNTLITTKTQLGKARITATTLQTTTGKARIQQIVNKTILGLAIIQQVVTKTTLGKARITATTTQTQTGKADIRKLTTQTQLGKSRIQQVVTQLQTGKSRIQLITNQTIQGKARVTATTAQVQLGKARITATTTQTQQGKGRIQQIRTQLQTGLARLSLGTTKTQPGKARVTATTQKTQMGVAKITATTTQTTSGKGRIQKITSQTQTGKASIQFQTIRTQLGKARVAALAIKTIQGQARITITTNQAQTGKATIRKTVSQTQTGKAAIATTTVRVISGKADISGITQRNQTGKAFIKSAYGIYRNKSATESYQGILYLINGSQSSSKGNLFTRGSGTNYHV